MRYSCLVLIININLRGDERFREIASKTRARSGVEQLHDVASKTGVGLGVEQLIVMSA